MNLKTSVLISTFVLIGYGCTMNPFSVLPAAMLETKREAGSNYARAKKLEDDGYPEEAFWLYRRAANGRHGQAAFVTGTYYAEGYQVPQDYGLARRYFDVATHEEDIPEAYIYMSEIDFNGLGAPKNMVNGYKWMLIGTRDDPGMRADLRAEMDPEMSDKQKEIAQKHARQWLEARDRDATGVEL